ncbi:unnamed protein product [Adineta steineri]|uniref:Uncharacterized protein n=1 Tax=Adineta steineri TaxID=433720 RepID=A0A814K0P8_9BILA|nr:unnamed protein product [Adineta steineri]CAF1121054.1 unnamed protein product [Adineta steineri]
MILNLNGDCLYPEWKKTCQKYCMENQFYEIQLNQCYSMNLNQLTCKCNGQILTEKILNLIQTNNSVSTSTITLINSQNKICNPSDSCQIGNVICYDRNSYCMCENGTWISLLCPSGNVCKTKKKKKKKMLIEVHYGNASVLLVNGNCRSIHLLNYIRNHCCLSSSIKFDLCLLNNGEPFHLSSSNTKFVSSEKQRFPFHSRCVLTQIDEDGTYIPLLNDPSLITNDFLIKLRRATGTNAKGPPPKTNVKSSKQEKMKVPFEKPKRRRSLKSIAIVASIVTNYKN